MEPLRVSETLILPGEELSVDFACSGGPGGQKVNRTASKVILRFAPASSRVLTEAMRARALERLQTRLTKDGEIVIHASIHREQGRNLEEARERLARILAEALAPPPRMRRPTKPTRGSVNRRLDEKKRTGDKKRGRQAPGDER